MIWKPMLFKGPMVRAFLRKENPKRRTRRIIKFEANGRIKMPGSRKNWHPEDPEALNAAPYPVGSGIWVKETHSLKDCSPHGYPQCRIAYEADRSSMLASPAPDEPLEALRKGNPPDDKIPQFRGVPAELADAQIRIKDLAEAYEHPVAEAEVAKAEMNKGRPPMHGKKA